MILYICRARHRYTIDRFLAALPPGTTGVPSVLTYEEMFAARALPPSNLIFTDFDRLSQFELEIAAGAAEAMRRARPHASILNHPARFLQRHDLLERLWQEGLNPFRSARLELPLPKLRFPVFIRREGDASGPETALLEDQPALDRAIQDLRDRGIPLRGRLVVEYCAKADAEGFYRKYGAFRIGDRILPQHLQISTDWNVKRNSNTLSEAHMTEELDYIQANPHSETLLQIMDMAGADYGRIDYTIIDGRLVVFEINSNATLPGSGQRPQRKERREIVFDRLVAGFNAIDKPVRPGNPVRIRLPQPISHDLPVPVVAPPPAEPEVEAAAETAPPRGEPAEGRGRMLGRMMEWSWWRGARR